ncbi:hypothetical protein C8F04DRAFT_1191583 [Mycena alexandri]|uniref:Uncharacterized protein n=1 Tax=Mycena alexandri TaxID=1745969 RepID=A0AAD6WSC3_9AGAR|nr:hypothetical protein C8F04DRAFT_1191583 [Mycena alexandri]
MSKSKARRKRVSSGERKNLRLWAAGSREEVLKPHIEGYTDALERGWRVEREYLQGVCNEFHARFSWRLNEYEEPESVPEYDARTKQPEETLTDDEKRQKRDRIELLNKRIRRWFKYRARKLRKGFHGKTDPRKDPWTLLLNQLSGLKTPPKARQAYQQFMHEVYETDVAPVVAQRWLTLSSEGSNMQTQKKPTAAFRAEVARTLFAALPEDERNGYAERAKEEALAARKKYDAALKAPPSKSPEDRQKCIDKLGNFLGPIQLGILEHTGLHSVVLMGGPIPKYGGELQSVYCSYGRSRSAGRQHFPEWAGDRWDKQVGSLFKEYMASAFTPQEVAESVLPNPLDKAKYTLDQDSDDDSGSDSSDSDSDSDSNADSSDSDAPPKKKQKRAPAKRPSTSAIKGKGKSKAPPASASARSSPSPSPSPSPEEALASLGIEEIIARTLTGNVVTIDDKAPLGLSYDKLRLWNQARNGMLLAQVTAGSREALKAAMTGEKQGVTKGGKKGEKKRVAEEAGEVSGSARKSRRLNTGLPHPTPSSAPTASTSSTAPTPLSTPPAPPPAQSAPAAPSPPTAPLPAQAASATQASSTSADTPTPSTPPALPAAQSASATRPSSTSANTAPTPSTPPALPPAESTSATQPSSTSANTAPTPSTPPASLHADREEGGEAVKRGKGRKKQAAAAETSTSTTGLVITIPEDAPPWLRGCVAQLSQRDLGHHFTTLLETLVELETTFGFDEDSYEKLPAEHRPKEVSAWIKGGRDRATMPVVNNVGKYVQEWDRWWGGLQPKWRRRDRDGNLMAGGEVGYGDNWGVLCRAGPNGCLSVVASLYLWGTGQKQTPELQERWRGAVQDVTWMLEGLIESL